MKFVAGLMVCVVVGGSVLLSIYLFNQMQVVSPLSDTDGNVAGIVVDLVSPTPEPSPTPTPIPSPSPISTPRPTPTPKPSPTPTPLPSPATAAQMDGWFTEFANSQSISIETLRKIAVCESGYNQFARNGIYGGIFQFSANTWQTTRRAMNADLNPDLRFDAREAIKTAAFRLATLGSAAWPNCD